MSLLDHRNHSTGCNQSLADDIPSQQEFWSRTSNSSSSHHGSRSRNSILGPKAPQQELSVAATRDAIVSTILKVEVHHLSDPIKEDVLTEVFSTVAIPISAKWYDRSYGQGATATQYTVGYVEFDNSETALRIKKALHLQWVYDEAGILNISFLHPLPDGYTFLRCLSDEVCCMSLVVEAFNEKRSEKVVLKRATSSEGRKYIERELDILNQCYGKSPHIVQLIETDLNDGWLVVEHMGGGSFEKDCEPQNFTHLEVLQIAAATSEALSFLHRKNIVHRDVKPHNIFCERGKHTKIVSVKLADMGLATTLGNLSTSRAPFAGTKRYSPPEAFQHRVSLASDMWSWACSMAHLATGVKPYEGNNIFLPHSDELRDVLPPDFHELLQRCFTLTQRPTAAEAVWCCHRCLSKPSVAPRVLQPSVTTAIGSYVLVTTQELLLAMVRIGLCETQERHPFLCSVVTPTHHFSIINGLQIIGIIQFFSLPACWILPSFSAMLGGPSIVLLFSLGFQVLFSGAQYWLYTSAEPSPKKIFAAVVVTSCLRRCRFVLIFFMWCTMISADSFILALLVLAVVSLTLLLKCMRHWSPTATDVSCDDGETVLIKACQRGHEKLVQTLLEIGATTDAVDENGKTALMHASQQGHSKTVQVLLQQKQFPSLNGVCGFNKTALMYASEQGHANVVNMLLDHGAAKDIVDNDGNTAWRLAADRGHTSVLEVFLTYNDNESSRMPLLCQDGEGNTQVVELDPSPTVKPCSKTPLMIASQRGFTEVVRMLRKIDAAANAVDDNRMTALMYACKHEHTEVVEALLDQINCDFASPMTTKDKLLASLIAICVRVCCTFSSEMVGDVAFIAASVGFSMFVFVALTFPERIWPNTDAVDKNGKTALMYASEGGNAKIVKILLDKGTTCDAGRVDNDGYTALLYASKHGHNEVIEVLLRNRPVGKWIPYRQYVSSTWEKIKSRQFRILTKEAIVLLAVCGVGFCFPTVASVSCAFALFLLPYHLCTPSFLAPNAKMSGKTALSYACEEGSPHVAKKLMEVSSNYDRTELLMRASQRGRVDIVQMLLGDGASPNAADRNGMTALMYAAKQGHREVVTALAGYNNRSVTRVASIFMKRLFEFTWWALASVITAVAALIDFTNGSLPHITAGVLTLPLIVILGRIITFVVRQLALPKIDLRDSNGKTALMHAREQGHDMVVKTLLAYGATSSGGE